MSLASEQPTAVLDWNNNYGEDENKVMLFHCGPVAQSLMTGKGTVTEHKMFAKNDPDVYKRQVHDLQLPPSESRLPVRE